jgi:hypothetical protein
MRASFFAQLDLALSGRSQRGMKFGINEASTWMNFGPLRAFPAIVGADAFTQSFGYANVERIRNSAKDVNENILRNLTYPAIRPVHCSELETHT